MTAAFIVIEGPNGVGKTTGARLLAARLAARGHGVHLTAEPTRTRLGDLIRETEDELPGRALALAVAADRAVHVGNEITPALREGRMVVSDRYVPSSLVLQRLDGFRLSEIWRLNDFAPRPSLTIYLEEDPEIITGRLEERGTLSRFEKCCSPARELELYRGAYRFLRWHRWRQARIDCRGMNPAGVLAGMLRKIDPLGL
ncbi:dTMP kinase [Actinomadura sp. KC216]|uniref:dTMP kinase n=1 Tax=Actinomadura sp. KC216 TaxID=2530370 RepID=UPI001042EC98|nr:dTMP kinase [Actinomadura sp. KC216]TDB78192.1 dTMP kinase [Actinomadura sp. KC216]